MLSENDRLSLLEIEWHLENDDQRLRRPFDAVNGADALTEAPVPAPGFVRCLLRGVLSLTLLASIALLWWVGLTATAGGYLQIFVSLFGFVVSVLLLCAAMAVRPRRVVPARSWIPDDGLGTPRHGSSERRSGR